MVRSAIETVVRWWQRSARVLAEGGERGSWSSGEHTDASACRSTSSGRELMDALGRIEVRCMLDNSAAVNL